MIKFTTFDSATDSGFEIEDIFNPQSYSMTKTASTKGTNYTPELAERIKTLKPKDGKSFLLINALTSGEHYSSNMNGDYFPEDALKKFHKTFETHGHSYKHHVNKDPQKASGKVIFSAYNSKMHRVEIIVELDNSKAKDILSRIDSGDQVRTSMGCSLPADECSVCGKKSKKVADYCSHLKTSMNKILPDGTKIYAINKDNLKFFDISFVTIPADKTSAVMKKLASGENTPELSAQVGEDFLKEAGIKEADLLKQVSGDIEAVNDDPRNLILNSTKDLPADLIKKATAEFSLKDILSTLLLSRIFPKPHQFQDIVLRSMGKHEIADKAALHKHMLMDLGEGPQVPVDVSVDKAHPELLALFAPHMSGCSLTKPLIMKRIIMMKTAEEVMPTTPATLGDLNPMSSVKNPMFPMIGLGALYVGYKELFNVAPQAGIETALAEKPYLIPLLLGAAAYAATKYQQSTMQKTADAFNPYFIERLLTTVPASYMASGFYENEHRQGKQLNNSEEFIREHPAVMGVGSMYGVGKLIQLMKKHGELAMKEILTSTSKENFDKLYSEITSNT